MLPGLKKALLNKLPLPVCKNTCLLACGVIFQTPPTDNTESALRKLELASKPAANRSDPPAVVCDSPAILTLLRSAATEKLPVLVLTVFVVISDKACWARKVRLFPTKAVLSVIGLFRALVLADKLVVANVVPVWSIPLLTPVVVKFRVVPPKLLFIVIGLKYPVVLKFKVVLLLGAVKTIGALIPLVARVKVLAASKFGELQVKPKSLYPVRKSRV